MPAATSKIVIVNRALQMLGQPQITSLSENSRSARAVLRAYDSVFLSELEMHTWSFSIRRANLAADPAAPIFGKARYFPLPGDFLFLAPEETTLSAPNRRDYEQETYNNTLCIVSDEQSPLPIRYVSSNITESSFSATFAEAFAAALAMACCEDVTNSTTKLQGLRRDYESAMARARRRNDIQKAPRKSPTCSWITERD